ncbi:biotin--[acetyl-CoA-carboxylase] ligase [Bacillaceae bacterium S4-13-58]
METTRKQLIELLSKDPNQFYSGQELSEKIGISRTAIWKHMNELKRDGYEIEAVSRKGYRIQRFPNKVSSNTLQWGLKTEWLGQEIHHFESVSSTQSIAHTMAQEGAPHGTVVIADEQTSGRGRLNRPWHSSSENGIWMSLVLRPSIEPFRAPQLTLMTATVLVEVIREFTTLDPRIKWPNDIMINGKKIAGILTELQAEQDQIQYVILGIGINVNQTDFPEEIKDIASSLKQESGQPLSRVSIIQSFFGKFEEAFQTYIEFGFKQFKNKWEQSGYRLGELAIIESGRTQIEGKLVGIDENGGLVVLDDRLKLRTFYSAQIRWEKEEQK